VLISKTVTKILAKCSTALLFVVLFSFSQSLFAKDLKPITHKLWEKITDEEFQDLKKIEEAIKRGNYDEALNYASRSSDNVSENSKPKVFNVAYDIILWNKYSSSDALKNTAFSDISRFINDNQFYPNMNEMRRNAEKIAINNGISYKASEQYFKSNPAITTTSKIYVLQSKLDFLKRLKPSDPQRNLMQKEVQDLISEIWKKENFSDEEEKSFLEKYQNQLTENDHFKRVERLLWDGKVDEAKKIIRFVDVDHQKLIDAIIDLHNYPRYLDQTIFAVPRKLRSNEGLMYRKALWYKSKGDLDQLIELMIDLPKNVEYPDRWWSLRHLYAREMLKRKEYKLAYLLAAKHSLPVTSSDFWEAEWFSGWVALRFLDEPKDALKHFDYLYKNVKQPVSLSRAAYWIAMSYQTMNDRENAIKWYKEATRYPIFFYGQLALNKHRALDSINAREDIVLPKDPEVTYGDMKVISQSKAARVAYLLALTGDKKNSTKIFEYLVTNAQTEGQVAAIMRIVNEFKDQQLDAKISRVAARKNVFFVIDKFQIVKEVPDDEYSPLVHAIIKQESGFVPTALSHVGAIGFMQLMPATAKLVAKDVGIEYDKEKLATDIKYNVKLGSHYIKTLIDRFDGSEMLAIASYNAGPNSAQRWINEFYDPRKEKDLDKIVDWIELITYSETRNYVQRILENLIVYKYLMSRTNYDTID